MTRLVSELAGAELAMRAMNRYTRRFIAACPNNGEPIIYDLVIEKATPIMVEHIIAATQMIRQGYHEAIADALHRQFGGRQVLRAHHHGVDIETTREAP